MAALPPLQLSHQGSVVAVGEHVAACPTETTLLGRGEERLAKWKRMGGQLRGDLFWGKREMPREAS